MAPIQSGLREIAAPCLQDLYAATRSTVHLAVRDGTQVLYLDRLSGSASVPVLSRAGSRLPLYNSGVGKVLLAHAANQTKIAVMRDLRPITLYTIVAPGILERQLLQIRLREHATTAEDVPLGACSVAVPIRNGDTTIAALGIVVPTLRNDRAALIAAARVAAQGVGPSLRRS